MKKYYLFKKEGSEKILFGEFTNKEVAEQTKAFFEMLGPNDEFILE